MSTEQNNIEALERAIMEEANEDARRILGEAQAKAERVQRQTQGQANAEREAILRKARQEAETLQNHAVAAAQRDAQTLRLARRENLLERTFAAARDELSRITERPDYPDIVRTLAREGARNLGAREVVARTDDYTRGVLTDDVLAELSQELNVRLGTGEPLDRGTGVLVETPDGHRRFDDTLETRLARMQESLRTPVYRILMGERG
jgi:V/A-type H+-transporting ATPase subunit E